MDSGEKDIIKKYSNNILVLISMLVVIGSLSLSNRNYVGYLVALQVVTIISWFVVQFIARD